MDLTAALPCRHVTRAKFRASRRRWPTAGTDQRGRSNFFLTVKRTEHGAVRHTSVRAWLDDHVHNAQLGQLLTAFACTLVYSTALDLVSAEVFVDKFKRTLSHPVHYIDGGWQTLIDGLRDTATRHGARVRRGAAVEAVIGDSRRGANLPSVSGALAPLLRPGGRFLASGPVAATTIGSRYLDILHRAAEVAPPRTETKTGVHRALNPRALVPGLLPTCRAARPPNLRVSARP